MKEHEKVIYRDLVLEMEGATAVVGVELAVHYTEGARGRKDDLGVPIEPDEGPTVNIAEAWLKDVNLINVLPPKFWDDVEYELETELAMTGELE